MLLDPLHPQAPKFWLYEQGAVLYPTVVAFLEGGPLTPDQVSLMRDYLRQWIMSPVWDGLGVGELRESVELLTNRTQIRDWLSQAEEEGIDPL